jgi:hypothetical protein
MKNNKKVLYILVPLVLGIWGIIAWKIISSIGDKNAVMVSNTALGASLASSDAPDTFSIVNHYRDPFRIKKMVITGGTSIHPQTVGQSPAALSVKKEKVVIPSSAWPSIVFTGIFKNQTSKKQVALLVIDNKSYTVKPGETVEGVLLVKAYRDSVMVKFGKDERMVRK